MTFVLITIAACVNYESFCGFFRLATVSDAVITEFEKKDPPIPAEVQISCASFTLICPLNMASENVTGNFYRPRLCAQ